MYKKNLVMDKLLKEFPMSCRGCNSSSKKMKDMFEIGLDEDFYKLTNIQINRSDNLPKLLCTECEEVILNCRKFQKQCQQTDFLLNVLIKKQSGDKTDVKLFENNTSKNTLCYCLKDTTLLIKVSAPDMKGNICYQCPQKCPQRFKKKTDLLQHLIRHHNMPNDFEIHVQYYCSVPNCHYHVSSTSAKFFTGRKYLNQHIHKVHKGRTSCQKCHLNFPNSNEYERHLTTCNSVHTCQVCNKEYKTKERLVVHLMRKHPDEHKKYKLERNSGKRKVLPQDSGVKNVKTKFAFDNSKISSATQTLKLDQNIRNDVSLPSWQKPDETKKDEISTQTAFDELFKSQSDEYSLFYTESVSDIQTQTAPLEFGLSRSHKETITSETQSPDLSIKETQTCLCLYDSLKTNLKYDSMASNPFCMTSAETQTLGIDTDLLSFSSAETQTCFDELNKDF